MKLLYFTAAALLTFAAFAALDPSPRPVPAPAPAPAHIDTTATTTPRRTAFGNN